MPGQTAKPSPWESAPEPGTGPPREAARAPADTSAFFASRAQAASNGLPAKPPVAEPPPQAPPQSEQPVAGAQAHPEVARHAVREPSKTAGADDAIYQRMVSEWPVDPPELVRSDDLNWESVWDHGWSPAAAAEGAPGTEHTGGGRPGREARARPGPGAVGFAGP